MVPWEEFHSQGNINTSLSKTALTWRLLTLSWVTLFLFISHSREGRTGRSCSEALTFSLSISYLDQWAHKGIMSYQIAMWFTMLFRTVYESSGLWSRYVKDLVYREDRRNTSRMTTVLSRSSNLYSGCGIWTGGEISPPHCSVGFSVTWDPIVNVGDGYIFDNIVRILFAVREAPALISKPQESQVARSHIKDVDEQPGACIWSVSWGMFPYSWASPALTIWFLCSASPLACY